MIVKKTNLSEDIMALIKEKIIEGEINPGDRIIETKLAKELGISQTPIREALQRLSGEGIITLVPNKGPVVKTMTMQDVFEIYSMRAMLEGLAMRMAIQHATPKEAAELEQFYMQMKVKCYDDAVETLLPDSSHIHQTIVNLSRHQRLIATYESISFQIALVNRILGRQSTKLKEIEQHKELIDALLARDPDNGERIIRMHVHRSYREFAELGAVDGDSAAFPAF